MKNIAIIALFIIQSIMGYFVYTSYEDKGGDYYPPIAVVDMKSILSAKNEELLNKVRTDGLTIPELNVRQATFAAELMTTLDKLRTEGFVIVNRKQLIAAPLSVDFTHSVAKSLGVVIKYDADAPLTDMLKLNPDPVIGSPHLPSDQSAPGVQKNN